MPHLWRSLMQAPGAQLTSAAQNDLCSYIWAEKRRHAATLQSRFAATAGSGSAASIPLFLF
jgi:hypothetical protein